MRIVIGSDHAGFELKKQLASYLSERKHEVLDVGTHSTETTVSLDPYAARELLVPLSTVCSSVTTL